MSDTTGRDLSNQPVVSTYRRVPIRAFHGRSQHNGMICACASGRTQVWFAMVIITITIIIYIYTNRSQFIFLSCRAMSVFFSFPLSKILFRASSVGCFPNHTGVNASQLASWGCRCFPLIVLCVRYIIPQPSRTIDCTVARTLFRFFNT